MLFFLGARHPDKYFTQSYAPQQPFKTGTIIIPNLGACQLIPMIFPLLKIFFNVFEIFFKVSIPETQENQPSTL